MKNQEEIWKPIKGFPNYKVSNLGNVKRTSCIITYSNGNKCNYPEKKLSPEKTRGYLRITLSYKNRQSRFLVHRLVAIHFLDNKENKPCVNHIDGNKLNNCLYNLEWCTYSENEIHSYEKLGKINNNRKLSDKEVEDIRNNAIKGVFPFNKIKGNISFYMEKYNVSRKIVLNVLNKKYYV